jgi:hypothetical protein
MSLEFHKILKIFQESSLPFHQSATEKNENFPKEASI